MKISTLILAAFLLMGGCKKKENMKLAIHSENENQSSYTVETVVEGLEIPWGIAFLPDKSMLITEKKGELIHFKDGQKTNIENLPDIYVRGQGGLLDVQIDPNYADNGWIYLTYSSDLEGDGKGGNTTLMRTKLSGKSLVESEVLYKATPNTKRGVHFGSRIVFDAEGHIYFSIGDRGNRNENPQDITKDGGKVYRLNKDGSIPSDNPFTNENNSKQAIYSYGHRNIQGMDVHPETGDIWTHEHGPQGGDEINIIAPGKNYGWPKASFGINYDNSTFTENTSLPGMEDPIHYWVPSIAPCGMAFVRGDKYPNWKGNLLIGSLKFQYLNRCVLEGNKVVQEEELIKDLGRVRSVVMGPDGYIYVGVEFKGIVKILPN